MKRSLIRKFTKDNENVIPAEAGIQYFINNRFRVVARNDRREHFQVKNKIAKKWLKQALHDLKIAEKNIAIEGYDVASFLAHQSIEKLLKAIFIIRGKKMPKSHYIDELSKQLNLEKHLINSISELTVDYTFSRYPDVSARVPYEEYNEEIANEKVKIAKTVFKSLNKLYKHLLEKNNG